MRKHPKRQALVINLSNVAARYHEYGGPIAQRLVDAIYAGRLIGSDALAGISLAIPLLTINTAATAFISSGVGNLLSRAIGYQDKK